MLPTQSASQLLQITDTYILVNEFTSGDSKSNNAMHDNGNGITRNTLIHSNDLSSELMNTSLTIKLQQPRSDTCACLAGLS
jgi:hypothetical protein